MARPAILPWGLAFSLVVVGACAPSAVPQEDDTDEVVADSDTVPDVETDAPGPEVVHPHDASAAGIFGEAGEPMALATAEQLASFRRGEALFRKRFTPDEGLEPQYNGVSCASCHERPVVGGGGELYRSVALV